MENIKVTGPEDKGGKLEKLKIVVSLFEEKLKKEEDDLTFYHLILSGEYNNAICNAVQELYMQAGWRDVVCKTSSANGERGGLTSLKLYR